MSYKSFSYLIFYPHILLYTRHDQVNLSTLPFDNINLTKAMPNLLFARKFNLNVTAVFSICTLNPLKLL